MSLELNCAPIYHTGDEAKIPPDDAKPYGIAIGPQALQEYIREGGKCVVIPVECGRESER